MAWSRLTTCIRQDHWSPCTNICWAVNSFFPGNQRSAESRIADATSIGPPFDSENHAETPIEQGGPVVYYSGRQKFFWPQLVSASAHAGTVQTPNVKPFKRRTP